MRSLKQTIQYLDELQALGFTDEAFWRMHHFREKGEHHPIKTHRSYCENIKSAFFEDGGTNERVQARLEIILQYFNEYHRDSNIFDQLADAAYVLIPTV
jgi:hypothetical protein